MCVMSHLARIAPSCALAMPLRLWQPCAIWHSRSSIGMAFLRLLLPDVLWAIILTEPSLGSMMCLLPPEITLPHRRGGHLPDPQPCSLPSYHQLENRSIGSLTPPYAFFLIFSSFSFSLRCKAVLSLPSSILASDHSQTLKSGCDRL